jgi:hypothetical protein
MTFADRIIQFNRQLVYGGKKLPVGIQVLNPFQVSPQALEITAAFYQKYYNDERKRFMILGINPGRFGAGLTGIPFTDPKRLVTACNIAYEGKITHEPSSVFVYEVIQAYGGVNKFYNKFHINSVCPLGFTSVDGKGKEKNYNYYDKKELTGAVRDFTIENIKKQIAIGVHTDTCICLGTGKNEKYLREINDKHHFFNEIIPLEHPRFIMQYKFSSKQSFIDKYISVFNAIDKKHKG